jgi:hypothetical protein
MGKMEEHVYRIDNYEIMKFSFEKKREYAFLKIQYFPT